MDDELRTSTTEVPVGLLYQMWETPDVTTPELIERALEEFTYADALGFDSVWVGEHHFVTPNPFYGRIPAPELLVARAVAQTKHLRVGPGVKVLSTVSAIRAAEEMCMLDIITGGRADFGIGQGTGAKDEDTRRERQQIFRERLGDILRLLNADTSTGLPVMNVGPAPQLVSNMWAACRDEASIEFVAERGLNFVVGQAETGRSQREFVDRYRAAGGTGLARGVRAVYIAETREQALEEFADAFDAYYSVMGKTGSYASEAIARGLLPSTEDRVEDRLARASLIVGDPETVARELSDYVEMTGVDRLDLLVQFPALGTDRTRTTMRLFIEQVRPQLSEVLALV